MVSIHTHNDNTVQLPVNISATLQMSGAAFTLNTTSDFLSLIHFLLDEKQLTVCICLKLLNELINVAITIGSPFSYSIRHHKLPTLALTLFQTGAECAHRLSGNTKNH